VKVADFGIGKLLIPGSSELTRTGHMIGSPAYMSPEQIRGEKLDGRSDLFSLGVVFYELLTGVKPFPGDSITTLVYQILHLEPRDPVLVKPELPPATSDVFARLLAKTPDKRPASAREFLQEVDRIQSRLSRADQTAVMSRRAPEEKTVASGAVGLPPAPPPPPDRRAAGPGYLFGAAALILAAAALVWIWKSTSRRQEPTAGVSPAPVSLPAQPTAAAIPTAAVAAPPPTAPALPTAGPSQAADAIVGAPRIAGAGGTPISTLSTPRRDPSRPRRLPRLKKRLPPARPARAASPTTCIGPADMRSSEPVPIRRGSTSTAVTSESPMTGTTVGEARLSRSAARERTACAWSCRATGRFIWTFW
jgi:serine/threonine-protein kinase